MADAVDAYLRPVVDAGLFSGTVLLARGGEIVAHESYGHADLAQRTPNTAKTRYKIMSVTKSITAVALLRLVQAERLAVDDPVGEHLPAWPAAWASVRVRHLLDHTSGIPNLEGEWIAALGDGGERGLAVWRRLAPRLRDRGLDAAPGARHLYTNFHYVLLGAVAEAATGRDYPEIVATEVFAPAGMTESGFDDGRAKPRLARGYFRGDGGVPEPRGQDMSVIQAAGGMYATARDLYRFDRALRRDDFLAPALRKRMVTPAPNTYGYALGWQVRPIQGRPCARHSGGANGYVADLLRFEEDDACVVLVSNFAFAPSLVIAQQLAGCLFGRDVDAPVQRAAAELDRLAGTYRGPSSTALVRRSGRCLALYELVDGAARVTPTLLIALDGGRFRRQAWPTLLRFDDDGGLRMLGPQPATFRRADPDLGAWRKAAGAYRDDDGARYRLSAGRRGLVWRLPEGWGGRELVVVPVDAQTALTLFAEDFATQLALAPDRLLWTRNDGRLVTCRRIAR